MKKTKKMSTRVIPLLNLMCSCFGRSIINEKTKQDSKFEINKTEQFKINKKGLTEMIRVDYKTINVS